MSRKAKCERIRALIHAGHSNQEIATNVECSMHTVKIIRKLGKDYHVKYSTGRPSTSVERLVEVVSVVEARDHLDPQN